VPCSPAAGATPRTRGCEQGGRRERAGAEAALRGASLPRASPLALGTFFTSTPEGSTAEFRRTTFKTFRGPVHAARRRVRRAQLWCAKRSKPRGRGALALGGKNCIFPRRPARGGARRPCAGNKLGKRGILERHTSANVRRARSVPPNLTQCTRGVDQYSGNDLSTSWCQACSPPMTSTTLSIPLCLSNRTPSWL
jgi:hypothetical protein